MIYTVYIYIHRSEFDDKRNEYEIQYAHGFL